MEIREFFRLENKRKSQSKNIDAWYWTFKSLITNASVQVITYHFDFECEAWQELEFAITGIKPRIAVKEYFEEIAAVEII